MLIYIDFEIWENIDSELNMEKLVAGLMFPKLKCLEIVTGWFDEDLENLKKFCGIIKFCCPNLKILAFEALIYSNERDEIQREFVTWAKKYFPIEFPTVELRVVESKVCKPSQNSDEEDEAEFTLDTSHLVVPQE